MKMKTEVKAGTSENNNNNNNNNNSSNNNNISNIVDVVSGLLGGL